MKEVYITLACTYHGEDMRIMYAGDDLLKAKSMSKSHEENGWYVWVETWVGDKKINSEDIK